MKHRSNGLRSRPLVPALALAASWWNNDWKYRKEISFDLSPPRRRHRGHAAGRAGAGAPVARPISATSTTPNPTVRIFAWWPATTRRR